MLRSETAANPDRMARALRGLRRYQEAERPPRPAPMPAIAARMGAALRDYGGEGPLVLFVPSLINPPNVLDLDERHSLLRWLAGQGFRVLLLDWGWPGADRQGFSVTGHVEQILLPLIGDLGEAPLLAGYCLGGTMALAAAVSVKTPGVAMIAAPWRFSGFPEPARASLARLWRDSEPAARALGVLPMELLQSAFWSFDPARTIAKFEAFADLEGEKARSFVTLEDWANDGPPIPTAAARELFEDFFERDLPGSGLWKVAGRTIDPAALGAPLLNVVSTSDRIVPAASAAPAGERIVTDRGHVGMIAGSGARAVLWEPLRAWLARIAAR